MNAVTGPSTATPRAAGGALGRYAPWAALLVGLVVTWGLWSYAKASAEARARIEFDFRVADVRRAVAQRMDTYAELLRGAAGLFDAGLAPDRNAWHLYVQSLDIDRTYPGIFGIGYAPLVGGTDREAFEAAVGMRDGEPFAIVPAGRRDAYAPVLYLEPLRAANRRIIGADMFSAPGRREALERSRDRGAPAMTGVVQLMQNKGERTQPGFLVYFPIYRGGMRPGTVEERRRTLQGWVYGPFHASDLMKGVLGANPEGLEIEIDDVTAGSERLFGGPSSTPGDSGSLSSRTKLSIFDRDWQITVNAPGGAQTFSDRMAAAHGFAAGSLGLTLLLFLLVRNLAHTRERAEDIARDMTQALAMQRDALHQSEERFRSAFEFSATGMGLLSPSRRWVRVNRAMCNMLGCEERDTYVLDLRDMTVPADRARVDAAFARLETGEDPWVRVETHWLVRQAATVSVVLSIAPLRDASGALAHYVCEALDVTESEQAAAALALAHERLGLAIDSSNLALWDFDLVADTISLSQRLSDIFGVPHVPTLPITALYAMLPKSDQGRVSGELVRVLKGELPMYQIEHGVLRPDGTACQVLVQGRVVARAEDGRALRMTGTVSDTTAMRKAESALRDSETRFRVLFEQSSQAYFLIDDTGLLDCNPAALALMRVPHKDDLKLRTTADISPEFQPDGRRSADAVRENRELARRQGFLEIDWIGRRPDGSEFPAKITLNPVRLDGREAFLSVWMDVTAQRNHEQQLKAMNQELELRVAERTGELERSLDALRDEVRRRIASESELQRAILHLQTLLSASPIAITFTIGNRIVWANDATERMFGWKLVELTGHGGGIGMNLAPLNASGANVEILFGSREEWRRRARRANAVLAEGRAFDEEVALHHRSGRAVPVRLVGKAIDPTDLSSGAIWLAQDITTQKQAEAMLRKAKDAAELANSAKSEFLANMSHELRTPMHAIISFARLGLDRSERPEAQVGKLAHYFQRIDDSAARLLRLLNDLLDLSKLEAMKAAYDWAWNDMGTCAEDVVREYEALLAQRSLHVVVKRESADAKAWFDYAKAMQVIRNLVGNSIKFTPPGREISIVLGNATLPGAGSEGACVPALAVTVQDQGCGIPEQELATIFDKFVQSSKTKSGAGGTGLGLAICREIVAGHGGEIWARNAEGGGAMFTFVLPRGNPRETPAAKQRNEATEV